MTEDLWYMLITEIFLNSMHVKLTLDAFVNLKAKVYFPLFVMIALPPAEHCMEMSLAISTVVNKGCSPLMNTFPFGFTFCIPCSKYLQGVSSEPHDPSFPFKKSTYVISSKMKYNALRSFNIGNTYNNK